VRQASREAAVREVKERAKKARAEKSAQKSKSAQQQKPMQKQVGRGKR
jgi:large subunit ribosomal protein L24e